MLRTKELIDKHIASNLNLDKEDPDKNSPLKIAEESISKAHHLTSKVLHILELTNKTNSIENTGNKIDPSFHVLKTKTNNIPIKYSPAEISDIFKNRQEALKTSSNELIDANKILTKMRNGNIKFFTVFNRLKQFWDIELLENYQIRIKNGFSGEMAFKRESVDKKRIYVLVNTKNVDLKLNFDEDFEILTKKIQKSQFIHIFFAIYDKMLKDSKKHSEKFNITVKNHTIAIKGHIFSNVIDFNETNFIGFVIKQLTPQKNKKLVENCLLKFLNDPEKTTDLLGLVIDFLRKDFISENISKISQKLNFSLKPVFLSADSDFEFCFELFYLEMFVAEVRIKDTILVREKCQDGSYNWREIEIVSLDSFSDYLKLKKSFLEGND